ncbi:SymE family type I addiction module toxin [Lactonifactor longoviformis]|uniref:SymE family type I addiction module toxin n=1 Tax=Lactonifactor longoviformis TaxID=341220 RepID=UPI0036F2027D
MRKSKRSLKVIEQSGYKYKPTPALMLKGAWLEEWGFMANMPVTVQCEDGKLVITPREEVSYIDAFEESQMVGAIAEKKGRYC